MSKTEQWRLSKAQIWTVDYEWSFLPPSSPYLPDPKHTLTKIKVLIGEEDLMEKMLKKASEREDGATHKETMHAVHLIEGQLYASSPLLYSHPLIIPTFLFSKRDTQALFSW